MPNLSEKSEPSEEIVSDVTSEATMVSIPQSFDSSSLRFEYEAVLEEYRTLWTEIHTRIASQQQIYSYALTIFAAVFTVSQIFLDRTSSQSAIQVLRPVYPVLSLLLSAFALLQTHHNSMIAYLATYIERVLRPHMRRILEAANRHGEIWGWNEWRVEHQFHTFPDGLIEFGLSNISYGILVAPSIGFVVLFWIGKEPGLPFAVWEQVLFVISILGIALVIATGFFLRSLFQRLGDPTSQNKNTDSPAPQRRR